MKEQTLTPKEVAEILVVKTTSVKRWLQKGILKGKKEDDLWRVRKEDLDDFIQ